MMSSSASSSRPRIKIPAQKKKRGTVVFSDSEEDFDPAQKEDSELEAVLSEDDYFSDTKRAAKSKSVKGGVKSGRKKAEALKEITARDERKRAPEVSAAAAGPASKRPRTKSSMLAGEASGDLGGFASASSSIVSSPIKDDNLAVPAPPRKKLPQIKKTKTAGASSSGSPTTHKPPPVIAPESKSQLTTTDQRKPHMGSVDVDLSDPTLYASLFKNVGGTTVSNLSRRGKDEERRRELDKMREEARAKRINESAPAFDLQDQTDKIIRFEEKLRDSSSRYPNQLAGALRHRSFLASPNHSETREEGEM